MRRRALTAPLLIVLGLGAAACGDESTAGSAGPTTAAATTPEPTDSAAPGSTEPATSAPGTSAAVAEVPEILRFTAPLVGGGTFDAAAVAGTPLALWFWAPG